MSCMALASMDIWIVALWPHSSGRMCQTSFLLCDLLGQLLHLTPRGHPDWQGPNLPRRLGPERLMSD